MVEFSEHHRRGIYKENRLRDFLSEEAEREEKRGRRTRGTKPEVKLRLWAGE
jgi:hypothetical protein